MPIPAFSGASSAGVRLFPWQSAPGTQRFFAYSTGGNTYPIYDGYGGNGNTASGFESRILAVLAAASALSSHSARGTLTLRIFNWQGISERHAVA